MDDSKKVTRLKQVVAYTTEEEREIWREVAEKDGRTLSKLITMLLRQHCLGFGIDSTKPRKRPKK